MFYCKFPVHLSLYTVLYGAVHKLRHAKGEGEWGGGGVYTSYGIMRDKEGSIMAKKASALRFPVTYFILILFFCSSDLKVARPVLRQFHTIIANLK